MPRSTSAVCAALTVLGLLLLVFTARPAQAQSRSEARFANCASRTGTNATVVIPASAVPALGGVALQPGDEVAAFTSEDRCAGRVLWSGETAALTVWGDDVMTRDAEGYQPGDTLQFRLWDASEQIMYHTGNAQIDVALRTRQPYAHADLAFAPGGIYVLDRLIFMPLREETR